MMIVGFASSPVWKGPSQFMWCYGISWFHDVEVYWSIGQLSLRHICLNGRCGHSYLRVTAAFWKCTQKHVSFF